MLETEGLIAVGALIASLTAVLKAAIPSTEYPRWINLVLVGGISLGVLLLAVNTGRLEGDNFFLLSTWVNYVLASVGVRELATVPSINNKTLSNLPTRTGGPDDVIGN